MSDIDRAGPALFFRRLYPSANLVLVRGARPLLIDPGFGADVPATRRLLHDIGVAPAALAAIINTHYHADHAGGNAALQAASGTPVAAHRLDASVVNRRDREACASAWLDQPIEPYHVDHPLSDGDELETGDTIVRVVHTPGHTLGHISLYLPREGDAVHGDDVSWLNPFREGTGALERAVDSLDRLAALGARRAWSGHGEAIADPTRAIDAARHRYDGWAMQPERLGWHACKRILAYKLMLAGGLSRQALPAYLLSCPWFVDYTRHVFLVQPAEFVQPLLDEMLRSGAAIWDGDRLIATAPYQPVPVGWPTGPTHPADWPPAPNGIVNASVSPPRE